MSSLLLQAYATAGPLATRAIQGLEKRPPLLAHPVNRMFEGFELLFVDTPEAQIRTRVRGDGPPLLLLHGHPQTQAMWHAVAFHLAEEFTVVATDLRGYGESSKPPTTPDHEPYSKRAMARDQVAVMETLGFERFFVAGQDPNKAWEGSVGPYWRRHATIDQYSTAAVSRKVPEPSFPVW